MPIYTYKARDDEGRLLTGRIEALNEEDLQIKLKNTGFLLTHFSKEKGNFLKEDILQRFNSINSKDKYTLTLQLANTIDAGVPIMSALTSIIEGCRNKKMATVLEEVRNDLKSGVSFSGALGKHPRVFSKFFVSMLELGENSGTTARVLYELAEYIKRDMDIGQRIISAVMYPIILVCVATALLVFILTSIMPKFVAVYVEANVPLPLPTLILLALSKFLTQYWYMVLICIGGAVTIIRIIAATKIGRLKIDRLKLRLPLLGSLFRKLCIYQFIQALHLLYNSGLPVMSALRIVEEVVNNREMANVVNTLSAHLAKGESLVEYLKLVDFFPSDVLAMIKVGEEGGKLGAILAKVSDIYREEINIYIMRLVSFIEPALIVFMGIGVGFMAMSILFPIFQLSKLVAR